MTDRELLELAAKAAGYKLSFYNGYAVNVTDFHPAQNVHGAKQWNPLTDDGDALRLAVKLGLSLYINHAVRVDYCTPNAIPTVPLYEPLEPDVYAATRRAIVRAAAEIGKEQP